jgi:hypothetical protein
MEENTQVQKFDPATLMQGVKDRIKSTFVSLIPEEQWKEMIEKEVGKFFREYELRQYDIRYVSDFSVLVNSLLKEEAEKRMKEYLGSPEFQTVWTDNGPRIISQAIREMMIENSGLILCNMYQEMFTSMLHRFRSELSNRQNF